MPRRGMRTPYLALSEPIRLSEDKYQGTNTPYHSDSFTKREAAQENLYVKEKEMEKYVILCFLETLPRLTYI